MSFNGIQNFSETEQKQKKFLLFFSRNTFSDDPPIEHKDTEKLFDVRARVWECVWIQKCVCVFA